MPRGRSLWLDDFSLVPADTRRRARYGLRLFSATTRLLPRAVPEPAPGRARRRRARCMAPVQDHLLAALWQLTLPLLDAGAVAAFLAAQGGGNGDTDWLGGDDLDEWPADGAPLRGLLRVLFASVPRAVLRRLAAADGEAPTSPTVRLLGEGLCLDAAEGRVLDYLEHHAASDPLRQVLRSFEASIARVNLARLAATLDLPEAALRVALPRLRGLGLAEQRSGPADLEDFLQPSDLLHEVLNATPRDANALLAALVEPAPPATWSLASFPHLGTQANHLCEVLGAAARGAAEGVNALFHGPPGTGKTELARALAAACGLTAYQVRSADDDGDGLGRQGRLAAYRLAQRLLARRRDALLIFDEVEDAFAHGGDVLARLLGLHGGDRQKGWMNRTLEENPVPAIWITNDITGMDSAFLRRFLLPVAFATPLCSVRRQMAEYHLGDRGLDPALLDDLAADAALTPAHLGAARRLLDLRPQAAADETVRHGVAAMRSLLSGAPAPRRRLPATRFDVVFLNLSGDLAPGAIARALAAQGRGSLCFYGLPGTGKTAFAELLAAALDRELVARQASDLVSAYVGETEQNLARLFRECDPARSVLLLDEVDSFLADRRAARHSWERTQVNELLQQMDCYPGIFIAATNLMDGIDAAALRRFDFKLQFRALTPAQRLGLFAREALHDANAPVPTDLARHLRELDDLTPGDFAVVCRQQGLLGETLTPEQFLRRLAAECRLKRRGDLQIA